MPNRAAIEQIRVVAAEQHKLVLPLTDDFPSQETGLDSLCLAILVSRL